MKDRADGTASTAATPANTPVPVVPGSSPAPAPPVSTADAGTAAPPRRPTWRDRLRALSPTGRARGPLYLVIGSSVAYFAALGWLLSERYWAFQTYAWDLGVYNQAFYTTAFSHRLFYYSADLPSGNPGSLLAGHFAPVLFLLLPIYAVVPDPRTLLVLQAGALAAGAVPAFLLGRRATRSDRLGVLVAAVYLASPVLLGVGWYDFHLESLLPAAVLWVLYFYYDRRWKAFLLGVMGCLGILETIAPFLALFALAGLLSILWDRGRHHTPMPPEARPIALGLAISVAWIPFAYLMIGLPSHTLFAGTLGAGYSGNWGVLGPNLSFFSAIPYAILHPASAASALTYQGGEKAAYALVLFGALGFLPLLGPKRLLLPVGGWLALLAISDASSFYRFGDQYSGYPLPFLVAGAAFGLGRARTFLASRSTEVDPTRSALDRGSPRLRFRRGAPGALPPASLLVGVVLASLVVSPLLPSPQLNYPDISHGIPTVTAHDGELHRIAELVPANAAVLTVNPIFPELSDRVQAFVVPISSYFAGNASFASWLDRYVNRSSFVLLDLTVDFFGSSVVLRLANLSAFGVLAEAGGTVLYERGWTTAPILWAPATVVLAGGDLVTTVYSAIDGRDATRDGPALASVTPVPPAGVLWMGPYLYDLPPGTYTMTLWLTLTANGTGPQLSLDCVGNPVTVSVTPYNLSPSGRDYNVVLANGAKTILAETNLSDPTGSPTEQNVTMTFHWTSPQVWSTSAVTATTITRAILYRVSLIQTSVDP
ncbi:MAG TPA: DUF2079 domain-containing protein [Thermoplasmata archaeon]|nr:DUF2079 domain-containing protein [Thermoplasmata archaeon]